eukprot:15060219-Alexandrium_andersonii.AAC.1
MDDSPHDDGRPPPQRFAGVPSEPSPNGRRMMGGGAFEQQLGVPRSGAASCLLYTSPSPRD